MRSILFIFIYAEPIIPIYVILIINDVSVLEQCESGLAVGQRVGVLSQVSRFQPQGKELRPGHHPTHPVRELAALQVIILNIEYKYIHKIKYHIVLNINLSHYNYNFYLLDDNLTFQMVAGLSVCRQ
jgi:hypothetical protein